MKVGSKELFEVMRRLVREEVRKVLPEMVRTHLTETYIKRMVLEAAVRPARHDGKSDLSELLSVNPDVDEDHVPEPMLNTDRGIYNVDTLTKPENKKQNAANEQVRKLQAELGPLAFVLEDVKIPGENQDDPGIPEEKIQMINPDFARMSRLVESVNEASASKREMSTPDMKMRQLEMYRKKLERPINGDG